ncbi:tetratricopeptide repeat-containing sulfotransferase family protein [Roseibium algae]|uniref:Sulfotransferase n=1 Tax=Roseibium algae TaxID=3123038 RepID=A0ABU8TEX8_9HYPH
MITNVTRLAQDALAHQHAGRIDVALAMFAEVISHEPRHPQANFSLGIAAYQSGEIDVAVGYLQTASSTARKHPQVHQLLGLALLNTGNYSGARTALQKAVALAPRTADFHAHLGDLYRLQHKPGLSRQSFERALRLDPENGYGLLGIGQLEISLGNIDEAVKWFEKAISAGKELPSVLHRLAFAQTHTEAPPALNQIENLIAEDIPRAKPDLAELHWAAGKIYHDLGDSQHASDHYRKARRLRYDPFDQAAHEDRLAFMKQVFNKDYFAARQGISDPSERPIFIFGMPRSGTTLVEQIFARHTEIASGGELEYFRQTQHTLGLMGPPSAALERQLTEMDAAEFKLLARDYLKTISAIDKRARRVTDKMPHNFEMLWLMSLIFPKATFVHCVRSPADTCISLLSHALSPAHNYCRTQESVGAYFQSYDSLMKHWYSVLPVRLHTLTYETLVHNQEGESRRLIEEADLEWQNQCMEFYNGDTPVTTFSDMQVRRPMYSSSIGRWKRHKDVLTRMLDALGPLAPEDADLTTAALKQDRPFSMPDTANDQIRSVKTG